MYACMYVCMYVYRFVDMMRGIRLSPVYVRATVRVHTHTRARAHTHRYSAVWNDGTIAPDLSDNGLKMREVRER